MTELSWPTAESLLWLLLFSRLLEVSTFLMALLKYQSQIKISNIYLSHILTVTMIMLSVFVNLTERLFLWLMETEISNGSMCQIQKIQNWIAVEVLLLMIMIRMLYYLMMESMLLLPTVAAVFISLIYQVLFPELLEALTLLVMLKA